MTYLTPPSRREAVQDVLGCLTDSHCVILTTHLNADGDGAGSEVALASWLRAGGREAWIINPTPFPDSLGFMLPDPEWALDPGSTVARELSHQADLAVVLDTGEVPRIGRVMDLIKDIPSAVIDHHPPGPEPIPGVSFRDPMACATGELVYDVLLEAGGPWPTDAVQGLYVAILTDTGSFRFSNSSPNAHRIVASLLEKGTDPEEVHRLVYGNAPLRKLRLLQASLSELALDPEGGLAWMTVPTEAYQELGATPDDIEGLVDYPRGLEGVEVGLLFRETARGGTKISFRSNGPVDVNALARRFGGGGHMRASGAMVERPLAQVREDVLAEARVAIRERRGNEGE